VILYPWTAVPLIGDLQLCLFQQGGLEGTADAKDRLEVLHTMRVGASAERVG